MKITDLTCTKEFYPRNEVTFRSQKSNVSDFTTNVQITLAELSFVFLDRYDSITDESDSYNEVNEAEQACRHRIVCSR